MGFSETVILSTIWLAILGVIFLGTLLGKWNYGKT